MSRWKILKTFCMCNIPFSTIIYVWEVWQKVVLCLQDLNKQGNVTHDRIYIIWIPWSNTFGQKITWVLIICIVTVAIFDNIITKTLYSFKGFVWIVSWLLLSETPHSLYRFSSSTHSLSEIHESTRPGFTEKIRLTSGPWRSPFKNIIEM